MTELEAEPQCPSCHVLTDQVHTEYCKAMWPDGKSSPCTFQPDHEYIYVGHTGAEIDVDDASGMTPAELWGEPDAEPMTAEELRAWLHSP